MQTPLYALHQAANGKIVDFHGWDLPVHYGSQIEEHHAVRRAAGMFDVSHMTVFDIKGEQVEDFLRTLLANDVRKIVSGQALYSCLLNNEGGVIDDLIVYKHSDDYFQIVSNSATREKNAAWFAKQSEPWQATVTMLPELAILAVQGPQARELFAKARPEFAESVGALKPFRFVAAQGWLVARTGYTGEDGVEVVLSAKEIGGLWQQLLDVGVRPCGLGARDTLRLEAGLNLYGADMDEQTSPLEANLAWTIDLSDEQRNFIGKHALLEHRANGVSQQLIGVVLEDKGVLRNGLRVVIDGVGEGVITSGGFSPTIEKGIGFAKIPMQLGVTTVDIRGKLKPVSKIKLPFVRRGKVLCQPLEESEKSE